MAVYCHTGHYKTLESVAGTQTGDRLQESIYPVLFGYVSKEILCSLIYGAATVHINTSAPFRKSVT